MKHIIRLLALTLSLLLLASTAFAYPPGFLVHHGDRDQKRVCITVDDCYDAAVLRQMHELCVELDFPITWFVLGSQIRDTDKEVWEAIIEHGSEIGNHSWKHPDLTTVTVHTARNQILLTQERIDELLGYHYPLRLLRPPYGKYEQGSKSRLNLFYEYGVEKTVLWDVSNTDPLGAFQDTQNGSILLFHTNYKDLDCLKKLVPMLQDAGYELVTVSEMLGMPPLETSEEKYIFPYR